MTEHGKTTQGNTAFTLFIVPFKQSQNTEKSLNYPTMHGKRFANVTKRKRIMDPDIEEKHSGQFDEKRKS